jgi:hypothetical protein
MRSNFIENRINDFLSGQRKENFSHLQIQPYGEVVAYSSSTPKRLYFVRGRKKDGTEWESNSQLK